jgi:hypothetical protein
LAQSIVAESRAGEERPRRLATWLPRSSNGRGSVGREHTDGRWSAGGANRSRLRRDAPEMRESISHPLRPTPDDLALLHGGDVFSGRSQRLEQSESPLGIRGTRCLAHPRCDTPGGRENASPHWRSTRILPWIWRGASLVPASETLRLRRIFTLDRDFGVYRIHGTQVFEVVP